MASEIFNSTRVALEHEGLVAMAQRAGHGEQAGMYEIFGGKLEKGEIPLVAAERELWEELGVEAEFLTYAPLVYDPYEITSGKNNGMKCRVFGFGAKTYNPNLKLNAQEHIIGSEIWVLPDVIERMPNVTQASKIAMSGLKHLFY